MGNKKGLADYTREEIQEFVNHGICPVETLRDYDVVKGLIANVKPQDIAFDNRISRVHVYRVKAKYLGKL
jgi:hypothetical protein